MHPQHPYRAAFAMLMTLSCLASGVFVAKPASSAQQAKGDRSSIVNSLGLNLVLLAKGDFTMGSEEFPSEKPPRPARVTKDFYLAIHHVTVAQFRAFVKDTGYKTDAEKGGHGAEGFDPSLPWVV